MLLKPTGDAPILKVQKFAVRSELAVADLVVNIKKMAKLQDSESLFLYVNQAFAPALDEKLATLYEVYAINKKLVLHYATTEAWG